MVICACSRWQFGITTVYHFLFVPVTIGMAAFAGWLLEALAGHALRVVPLISWPSLRTRLAAPPSPGGRPGGPGLYVPGLAALGYCLLTAGVAAVITGFAVSLPALIAAGGGLLAAAGLAAAASLSARPLRMLLRPEPGQAGTGSRAR